MNPIGPGDTYLRAVYGPHARHVPAWIYVQDQGAGTVAVVGASRVPEANHPLRYGNDRTHQLIVGELIVRPHYVIATDALRGQGLAGLVAGHDLAALLASGELVLGTIPDRGA